MQKEISTKKIFSKLLEKFETISGENTFNCYQCGCCSAACPVASEMDLLPSQVMRYIQIGLTDEVLNGNTMWICATCYACQARCPRGIDIATVMETLRQIKLRKNEDWTVLGKIDVDELNKLPPIALISNLRKMTG
ncbi:MAG: 4Fe-4S dicluster domain-containing protein [Candidatus Cloacimonetes bacterium]|nr:4Fe-4S dicluster domain-containing protein [Candidatus Cloacimonadota bacterium]MBL7108557.1 4Fe-4S dicluster domain-containing protein [Candidatus Cloacimonadota bacterium]